ncbi:hypothetical protein BP6252_01850 [Coleophoma cylindrospora]|uniref:Prolyl 4-hydroxylase alpha subunit domain-containing protein n=1 Tax=Coleophoma cylindrospora TaxID=1849047 RepID=A0A3D8SD46_9HELO|nr:hypothetical protein BP6252_01850 [Coleophoma cylindrospora]
MAKIWMIVSSVVALFAALFYFKWEDDGTPACTTKAAMITTVLLPDPLIIYIENFLTDDDVVKLKDLAKDRFEQSTLIENGVKVPSPIRTSSTAMLSDGEQITKCVAQRAARFQNLADTDSIEPIQATRYVKGQQYKAHLDLLWSDLTAQHHVDRNTTIFAILDDNCTDCGTQFPNIHVDLSATHQKWCEFMDCTKSVLTVKPKKGNAVFWKNLLDDGMADMRSVHSGLPLTEGSKMGLNIWTRNGGFPKELREL